MEKNIDLEQFSQDLKVLQRISYDVKKSMFERLDVSRYENVSSRMLEFLFNSYEEHGIGNLAIVALLEEANIKFEHQPVTLECLSEVHTTSEKFDHKGFIDIVVHLQEYTLIIENKISHILNNPFELYQQYAKTTYNKKNGHSGNNVFIIMGINKPKNIPKNFRFVSHVQFCKNLKTKLLNDVSSQDKNKSYYFVQDYIEAIEHMSNTKLNEDKEEFFKFIAEHYQQLDQIQEQQKYMFDIANGYLEEILGHTQCKEKYFVHNKSEKNNQKEWAYKGYYVYSSTIKKVFNGSEIYVVLNVIAQGIFLSIAMHDNRRKKYYVQEDIIECLKGSRLISSSEKVDQIFTNEAILMKWNHTEFNPLAIAKKIDSYVEKIENISLKND